MGRRIWGFNFLLAGCLVVLLFQAYSVWTGEAEDGISAAPSPANGASTPFQAASLQRDMPSKSLYGEVVERNLLSPERKEYQPPPPPEEPAEKEPEPEPEPARISGREIGLHGVVQVGSLKKALIDNPKSGRGEKPNIWVEEGERLEDLLVSKIEPERILLEHKGKVYQVPLYEASERGSRPSRSASASVSDSAPSVITAGPASSAEKKPTQPDATAESRSRKQRGLTMDNPFVRKDVPLR